MGWTFYDSFYYKPNGEVDRKAEIDNGFDAGYTVLKSSMVGSTYYAAIKKDKTGEVFAYIALTSSDKKRGYNFGYKSMDETCGPVECQCPQSILKLLTPTDSEWANQWRERCRMYHQHKKSPTAFSNLPIGTVIEWTVPDEYYSIGKKGDTFILVKHKTNGKKAYWFNKEGFFRINPKHVKSDDYKIIHLGAA